MCEYTVQQLCNNPNSLTNSLQLLTKHVLNIFHGLSHGQFHVLPRVTLARANPTLQPTPWNTTRSQSKSATSKPASNQAIAEAVSGIWLGNWEQKPRCNDEQVRSKNSIFWCVSQAWFYNEVARVNICLTSWLEPGGNGRMLYLGRQREFGELLPWNRWRNCIITRQSKIHRNIIFDSQERYIHGEAKAFLGSCSYISTYIWWYRSTD